MTASRWTTLLACLAIASPARAEDACSPSGTAMYFGNGIDKTYDEAMWVALDDLPALADQSGIDDVRKYDVAYNHTDGFMLDVIEMLEQKIAQDSRFSWFLLNNLTGSTLRGLSATELVKYLDDQDDFISKLQTLVNAGIADSSQQDGTFYSADVAEQVRAYLNDIQNTGERVIVVAHSQGNMYANAARAQLTEAGAVSMFGIAAVADPAESAANGYVTSNHDEVINLLRTLDKTVLPANVKVPVAGDDFMGHGFEEIYVNASLPTRAGVVSMLGSIDAALLYPDPVVPLGCGDQGTPAPDTSAKVTGSITHAEKRAFTFPADAGNGVQIRLADLSGDAFVPTLAVHGPTGAVVTNGASGNDVAAVSFTAPQSGTYSIVISDGSSDTQINADYALYLTVAPGANEGGALAAGGKVSGTIDKGDLDSFTFSAQKGEGVQLRLTDVAGGAMMPAICVYDPSGTRAIDCRSANDVDATIFVAPKSGTYTVVVYDGSPGAKETGNYDLYFTIAPGANEGGELAPDATVAGTIDKGDLDSFTFSAQKGTAVLLRLREAAIGPMEPAMCVYDPSGARAVDCGSASDVDAAGFTAQKSGTYTVVVYDGSSGANESGEYDLYLTIAPGANEGGALPPGAKVSGTIDKGDLDSFTFSAQVGEGVQLRVADMTGGAMMPALCVYDPSGARAVDCEWADDVDATSFTAQKSGTYTVVVFDGSPGAKETGNYDLYFTIAPGANEGGELAPGGKVSGTIDKGDLDSYTFSAQANDEFELQVTDTGSSTIHPAIYIYDPSGATIVGGTGGVQMATATIAAQTAGLYTIVVCDNSVGFGNTGNYDLLLTTP